MCVCLYVLASTWWAPALFCSPAKDGPKKSLSQGAVDDVVAVDFSKYFSLYFLDEKRKKKRKLCFFFLIPPWHFSWGNKKIAQPMLTRGFVQIACLRDLDGKLLASFSCDPYSHLGLGYILEKWIESLTYSMTRLVLIKMMDRLSNYIRARFFMNPQCRLTKDKRELLNIIGRCFILKKSNKSNQFSRARNVFLSPSSFFGSFFARSHRIGNHLLAVGRVPSRIDRIRLLLRQSEKPCGSGRSCKPVNGFWSPRLQS